MGNNCKSCQCYQSEELLSADVRQTTQSKIKSYLEQPKDEDDLDSLLQDVVKYSFQSELSNKQDIDEPPESEKEVEDSNNQFKEMTFLKHEKYDQKYQNIATDQNSQQKVSKNQQYLASVDECQELDENSIFLSQSQDAKRERRQPYQFKNGAIYEGEWIGVLRDGVGTQTWLDTAKYTGSWKGNQANGHGLFLYPNGDQYEGHWENDKANGLGIYQHKNGPTYSGSWKNDQQDGKGIQTWADGSRFEGTFQKGFKEGFGIYKWSDGSLFKGQWIKNEINGIGHQIWCNGRSYQGHWQNNMMHGRGIYKWEDGRSYDGQYSQDKKSGYGIYTWPDGRRYEGYWKNGKQHGIARFTQQDGQFKYGQWDNGVRLKWLEEGVRETQFVKPQGWDEQKIVVKEILESEDARLLRIN